MNIIEFENIDVGYDEKVVLKDINLKIKSGEHFAILGANGSGKSTLMKLIQSQIHPRQTKNFKKEIFGKSRYSIFELKKELGVITNDLHNYFEKEGGYLSGFEVVLSGYYSSIGIFTHQDFTKEQIKKALEVMDFLEIIDLKDKKVSSMSTGQLRKCIVARALIHDPKAFVLDEPTVGLDIKAQINFIKLLQKISLKSTIILVTHDLHYKKQYLHEVQDTNPNLYLPTFFQGHQLFALHHVLPLPVIRSQYHLVMYLNQP